MNTLTNSTKKFRERAMRYRRSLINEEKNHDYIVDLVAEANGDGIRVVGETYPQYLSLTVNRLNLDKNLSKVNPPVRERQGKYLPSKNN